MMKLNRGLSFWQNPRTSSLKFSDSYEKDKPKDSEAKQLIQRYQTKPNQIESRKIHYLKRHIVLWYSKTEITEGTELLVLVKVLWDMKIYSKI